MAVCPSQKLLDRIADKWVTLILAALGSGGSPQPGAGCVGEPRPMRYSELLRLLAGVSQKMLTQTLRSLERDWPRSSPSSRQILRRCCWALSA